MCMEQAWFIGFISWQAGQGHAGIRGGPRSSVAKGCAAIFQPPSLQLPVKFSFYYMIQHATVQQASVIGSHLEQMQGAVHCSGAMV